MASPSKSTEEKKYDVALSFADEDRPYVDKVAGYLRAHRVRLFYDKYEEVGLWGKNLYTYLSEVYSTQAYYTVIFISKHYKEKVWTNHELTSVQERALREKGEYILPVRFDDTEIPGLTRTIGYLSLRDKTPEEFAELVRKKLVLEGLIADSPVTPPQPQNAAVGIAALPLAPTTEFVAEKGPPLNSRTAEPVSLPQQLAAQPPSLPAVIEQPQSTGGRKRVYAMLGLAGLCVGAVLGYLISQSSEESPVEPTPTPMARVQPSPQPPPDVRVPEPDVRSSPSPSPASPPPVRPTFDFARYTNFDIDGGDIRSSDGRIGFRNTDVSGCEALCRDSPGCVAYSYDKWGGTCYPKDQVGALLLDPHYVAMIRSDLQAVQSSAATNSCLYRNKAMSGEVAGSSPQPSASSCKAECEGNNNCVAYTYLKAERRCSILNNVTSRPRDDPNAESGTRMQNSC